MSFNLASLILDLSVIVIILIFVLISAKRGFVKTIIEFVGFLAAIILSFTISTPLAEVTYDKIIEPPIITAVSEQGTVNASDTVEDLWNSLPEFLTSAAEELGITSDSINQDINEDVKDGLEKGIKASSQTVIRPIIVKVIGTIYSILLIMILFFIVRVLANLLNKLFSFSVIGKLNRFLGGTIGAIEGVIFAFVVCTLITIIVSFTKNGFLVFTQANIDKSYIFKFFSEIFPFK